MKKFVCVMTVMALMAGNAFAQNNPRSNGNVGQGATQGGYAGSNDEFAWAPALGGLVVLGVVVGVTAAAAASTPSTFSH